MRIATPCVLYEAIALQHEVSLAMAPPASISCYPTTGLVDERRAAEILGLRVSTLRRWRYSGDGPEYIKLNSAVRYDPQTLAEFADAGRRRSTTEGAERSTPRSAGVVA
jgi:Helix-turn-helix domain